MTLDVSFHLKSMNLDSFFNLMSAVADQPSQKFTATHSYVAAGPDELTFDGGDEIAIFDSRGEWWLGEHLDTGAFGLVPRNHLAPNFSDDSEDSVTNVRPSELSTAHSALAPPAHQQPTRCFFPNTGISRFSKTFLG